MKAGKLLIGLLSGAVAGAAAGLLLAPKKGADTRKQLTDTGDDYIRGVKSKFNEFADNLSHKVDAVKSRSKATVSRSKTDEKINKAKAELHDMQS